VNIGYATARMISEHRLLSLSMLSRREVVQSKRIILGSDGGRRNKVCILRYRLTRKCTIYTLDQILNIY
jgi:hypothetical protein